MFGPGDKIGAQFAYTVGAGAYAAGNGHNSAGYSAAATRSLWAG